MNQSSKKERLLAIIRELENKNTNGNLDKEIADLKREVEDLEEIKHIEDKIDNLSQYLPSGWRGNLITASAIIIPLLQIYGIIRNYYNTYQTNETNKNLEEMMNKLEKNLKNKEKKNSI